MLQVHIGSQHKPDINYMYTPPVNINQTYATCTRRQSTLTKHRLQVHVVSQHKPDTNYIYTLSVNINQTYATGTSRQST
jgi:hypothetical protein